MSQETCQLWYGDFEFQITRFDCTEILCPILKEQICVSAQPPAYSARFAPERPRQFLRQSNYIYAFGFLFSVSFFIYFQINCKFIKKEKEKDKMSVDDILALFNEISIECGN